MSVYLMQNFLAMLTRTSPLSTVYCCSPGTTVAPSPPAAGATVVLVTTGGKVTKLAAPSFTVVPGGAPVPPSLEHATKLVSASAPRTAATTLDLMLGSITAGSGYCSSPVTRPSRAQVS